MKLSELIDKKDIHVIYKKLRFSHGIGNILSITPIYTTTVGRPSISDVYDMAAGNNIWIKTSRKFILFYDDTEHWILGNLYERKWVKRYINREPFSVSLRPSVAKYNSAYLVEFEYQRTKTNFMPTDQDRYKLTSINVARAIRKKFYNDYDVAINKAFKDIAEFIDKDNIGICIKMLDDINSNYVAQGHGYYYMNKIEKFERKLNMVIEDPYHYAVRRYGESAKEHTIRLRQDLTTEAREIVDHLVGIVTNKIHQILQE